MTERETATEYLEAIQRLYLIKRYGIDFEKKLKMPDKEGFYDFIESSLKGKEDLTQDQKYELEAKLKGHLLSTTFLNTEYESFLNWQILSTLFENVKKILPTNAKLPYIGTIESGNINAEAYSIKGTEITLILIEGELFICGNLLCKIITQSIPLVDNESFSFSFDKLKLDRHLENKTLTTRFNDFLYNAINRNPSKSKQYFLESDFLEDLNSILLDSLEHFVVGHEYGHIYLNHFSNPSLKDVSLNLTNKDLLKIHTSWEQEFQADNIGAQIIVAMDKSGKSGEEFPYSVLGPDLLFTFFHYKNEFSKKNSDDFRQESDTHPAPLERKKHVREYILSRYVQKDQEILNITYKLIDNIFTHHIDNYKTTAN